MIKRILHTIFISLLALNIGYAQDADPILIIAGSVRDNYGKKLSGVKVSVKKNNQPLTIKTTTGGKYDVIEAPFGFIYLLSFEKNGYVTKSVLIDAKNGYFKEDQGDSQIPLDMTIFSEEENIDYSTITDQPVGKLRIFEDGLELDNVYNSQRKTEIDKFFEQIENQAKQKELKFNNLVTDGNKLFSKKEYANAILKYEEALKIKSDNVVSSQLANAKKNLELVAEQKDLQNKYDEFISSGDKSVSGSDFKTALENFNKAKELIPGNKIAYIKIKEVEKLEQAAKDQELAQKFNSKMIEAKSSFDGKAYDKAISLYNEAAKIDPSSKSPKERIDEINSLLATQKSNEEEYQSLIKKADEQFTKFSYDEAISNYKRALLMKPDESILKEKINKAEIAIKEALEKSEIEKKFQNIVKNADLQLKNLEYEQAKSSFQKALAIKSEDNYSQEKIKYIDTKLQEIIDGNNQKEKILKEYQQAIVSADKLYGEDKLQEAITSYELAKKIKADESYPEQKINEIKIKLTHLANQIKEKNKKVDDLVKEADVAFKNKNWKLSQELYNDALDLDDSQKHPQDQLAIITEKINEESKQNEESKEKLEKFNDLLKQGDQSVKEKNYQTAMNKFSEAQNMFSDDAAVKQKINHLNKLIADQSKANSLDSNYNQLITQADQLRDNDDFDNAIKTYNQAIKLKPLESYSKSQIELINNKIANLSKEKIQSQYADIIKNADLLFNDQSYEEALKKYDEANEISPNEPYPIDKIRAIKKLLIEKESKDNQYQRFINQADNEFESGNWKIALTDYKSAVNIYDREHPKDRIEEINKKLEELKAQEDMTSSEKIKYDDLIKEADQFYTEKKYSQSKEKFQQALNLFRNEYYPKKKLAEIELILKEIEVSNVLIEQYNNLISKADALRLENKLEEAKVLYQKANDLNPSNPIAQEKIVLINESIDKINKENLKIEYDQLVKKADDFFASKNYKKAREFYKKANSFEITNGVDFSSGSISRKIIEINQLIADESNSKLDSEKQNSDKEKYELLIQKAAGFKSNNDLLKSKELYLKASKILPDDPLPTEKIKEIEQLMLSNIENESKSKYENYISKAEQFFTNNNYDKSVTYYRKALSVLPDDNLAKEKIKEVSKAKIDYLNNIEKQKQYNTLVKQGNRYFESKNYSMAIISFQNASKIDSDQQLPKNKVIEINKLLDESSNNGLSNNQSILNSYSLLYGQEVTGKYDEDKIEEILGSDNKGNSEIDNMNSEFKKDLQQQNNLKYTTQQELKSNYQTEQVNLFYKNIQKSYENSDDARWKNIPKVIDYKFINSSNKGEIALTSLDKIMRNHESLDKQNIKLENKQIVRAEIIAKNNLVTDNFFDEKSLIEMERVKKGISVTYANFVNNESLNYQMELDNLVRSNNINMWAVGIDNFKQESELIKENTEGHYGNITYNNHISSENMLTLFNEANNHLDKPRIEKNIPSFGYYENDYFNLKSSNSFKNILNTYSQFENTQKLVSKTQDFTIAADDSRKENVNVVDHYTDKEISKKSIWSNVSNDKVYNLHFLNNMYRDDIDVANEGREDSRTENVNDLESYNNNYYSSVEKFSQNDNEADYFNAQQLDNAKSRMVNLNSIKNIQKLAQLFPEGVTEKIYEQKDSNGDVSVVTIIRIVVKGNKGDEYKKVRSKWGIGYFKNGGVISQNIWDTETN